MSGAAGSSTASSPAAEAVAEAGLVPVLVLDEAARGPLLLDALAEGGIRCIEVTLRTEAGLGLIELAVREHPELLVGAGTVLTRLDVERVADAGARFMVSPGLDEEVVGAAQERGMLAVPGVATASEVLRARALGLRELKLFPAEPLGGVAAISALAGPFPDVRFMPSGGLTAANASSYLQNPAVFAISGGWMASRGMIASGDAAAITQASREAVELVAQSRAGS